jgi:hypothetical protein
MLLTVPWILSISAGRVNLDGHGKGLYAARPKLTPKSSIWETLTKTGVNCKPSVAFTGKVMIITRFVVGVHA